MMKWASLLLVILCMVTGCKSSEPAKKPDKKAPPTIQLPTFDLPEVVKVRPQKGYAIVRDVKLHVAGTQAKVYRKGKVVGEVRVHAARRRPFIIVKPLSGRLQPGDTLQFME